MSTMLISVRQEDFHAFVTVSIVIPLAAWQKINELLEDPANDRLIDDLFQDYHDSLAVQKEAQKRIPYDVATFSIHSIFIPETLS